MRVGRGTRAAAVLMAGLVGAAVIAPGVALAQEPTVPLVCAAGTAPSEDGTSCEAVSTGSDTTGSTGSTGSTPEVVETTIPTSPSLPVDTAAPGAPETTTTTPSVSDDAAAEDAAQPQTDEETATKAAPDVVDNQLAASAVTPAQVTDSLQSLTGLDLASGLPIADVLKDLPTGNLDLGDLTIPEFPSSGSFSSPRDACLFLASKVSVAADQAEALGQQFASFCGALPGSFDPSTGYGSLPDVVVVIDKLCRELKDTHHHHGHYAWHGRDDINCDDVTAEEAQAIYEADRSDPNNLDGDDDGRACEWNPDGYRTVTADYDGYPQGGVATGDSAPGAASGGAAALAGLGVASLTGAGRRRDEAEELV
ncbi:hypothetical protein [Actinomycetospora sp. CA-084318]|uniref:excalibur calcium-binding domain-containing protein n=1 Tax=Actinomycetospora sp. CA-084318 TaxID=3239892 RepID=UPI003D97540E